MKKQILRPLVALTLAISTLGVATPAASAQGNAHRINVGQQGVRELRNGNWRLRVGSDCRMTLYRGQVAMRFTTESRNQCANGRISLRRSNNGTGNRVFFGVVNGGNNISQATVSDGGTLIANIRLSDTGELRGFDRNNNLVARNLQNEIMSEIVLANSQITIPNQRLTANARQRWISEYVEKGGKSHFEREVVRLVNAERVRNGLNALTIDPTLGKAARFYTQTMANLNTTLTHNAGPYGRPGDTHGASANVAAAFGANLRWNGGNGAAGHGTPAAVVNGWMNSPGHRAYILSPEHQYIGAGTTLGGRFGIFHYLFMSEFPSNS